MGRVFNAADQWGDPSAAKDCETPSVVWNDKMSKYIMTWHSGKDYYNVGRAQVTYISLSEDGVNWTYEKIANDKLRLSHYVGDGHDGYWGISKRNGYYYAGSLLGGGDNSTYIHYWSIDGLKWIPDPKQYRHINSLFTLEGTENTNGNEFSLHGGWPMVFDGRFYKIGFKGVQASATDPVYNNLYVQEFTRDALAAVSDSKMILELSDSGAGYSHDVKGACFFTDDDGTMYCIFGCKMTNGDYNFNLLKITYN